MENGNRPSPMTVYNTQGAANDKGLDGRERRDRWKREYTYMKKKSYR